jgi:hypothetical protein
VIDDGLPAKIAINPDDDSARYIGWTVDRRQFFLTTPFVPAHRQPGCEFLALYTFDAQGCLLGADIVSLGPRAGLDAEVAAARRDALLASLGEVFVARIEVAPFSVERFGVTFGLIVHPPEEDIDHWRVTVEPGDYMCFHAPFLSGDYDT